MSDAALAAVLREVVRRNGVGEGIVYLQVSRGAAPRDFAFPKAARPSLVVTARRMRARRSAPVARPGSASSPFPTSAGRGPTSNQCRCCPTCSASSRRKRPAPIEAWQVDRDGNVTEGTSSNAWIVTAAGEVVTRQADHVDPQRRHAARPPRIIARQRLRFVERPFSLAEAKSGARGVPDQRQQFRHSGGADRRRRRSAAARPGPMTRRLAEAYARLCRRRRPDAMSAPRALLFDWDNTLVESWDAIHHALVVTFDRDGPRAVVARRDQGARAPQSARCLSRRSSATAGRRRASSISTPSPRPISSASHLLAGAAELLGRARARGPLPRRGQQQDRARCCGARPRISAGPASSRGSSARATPRPTSPMPRRFAWRSKAAGLSRPASWYIGDTALDMECAANAGCLGVLAGRARPGRSRLRALPAGAAIFRLRRARRAI